MASEEKKKDWTGRLIALLIIAGIGYWIYTNKLDRDEKARDEKNLHEYLTSQDNRTPSQESDDEIKKARQDFINANKNKREEKKKMIDSLGGVTVITESKGTGKCNLYEGYYLVNRKIDSSGLALLSQLLAEELFISINPDANCNYHTMSTASVYSKKEDYNKDKASYLATCSIMPTGNYKPNVFIPTRFE